jgi:hypothetical protein
MTAAATINVKIPSGYFRKSKKGGVFHQHGVVVPPEARCKSDASQIDLASKKPLFHGSIFSIKSDKSDLIYIGGKRENIGIRIFHEYRNTIWNTSWCVYCAWTPAAIWKDLTSAFFRLHQVKKLLSINALRQVRSFQTPSDFPRHLTFPPGPPTAHAGEGGTNAIPSTQSMAWQIDGRATMGD